MKLEFYRQIYIRFSQNLFSGSRVVSCGKTDMTKLIVPLRNFANAPNNGGKLGLDTMAKMKILTPAGNRTLLIVQPVA